MKKSILIIIFVLTAGTFVFAGNDKESGAPAPKSSIQGKVIDLKTSEELAGVTIMVEGTKIKAYTDIEGNFKIDGVEPGKYNLSISYISYQETIVKDVNAEVSTAKDLEIKLAQKN